MLIILTHKRGKEKGIQIQADVSSNRPVYRHPRGGGRGHLYTAYLITGIPIIVFVYTYPGSGSTKISNNLRGWSQSCQSLLLTGEVKKKGKWMVLITTCSIHIIGFICTHPGGSSTHVSCHLPCHLCFKNFIGTKRKQLIKGTLQDKHEKN